MRVVRLTPGLRSAIRSRAIALCRGSRPFFEVGMHWMPNGQLGCNIRLREHDWGGDLEHLTGLRFIELDDQGLCTIDLYATTGRGDHRELECNVYVTVDGETVIDANTNDLCPYEGYTSR